MRYCKYVNPGKEPTIRNQVRKSRQGTDNKEPRRRGSLLSVPCRDRRLFQNYTTSAKLGHFVHSAHAQQGLTCSFLLVGARKVGLPLALVENVGGIHMGAPAPTFDILPLPL